MSISTVSASLKEATKEKARIVHGQCLLVCGPEGGARGKALESPKSVRIPWQSI